MNQNIKQQLEEVIKKNLPEKLEADMCENPCDSCLKGDGFNQALSQIPVSLIADEVLKVMVEKIEEEIKNKIHIDIHKSLNWGMESKERVIHYNDILRLLSNLSPNKENKNNE